MWVSANDRAGVERLCRYILRPSFARARLRLRGDGHVALESLFLAVDPVAKRLIPVEGFVG